MAARSPQIVFVLSGKRKSGKDYVSDLLQKRLGEDQCALFRLSCPLKRLYAKEHDLDYSKLLDASDYKENFRADMIKWGEKKRNEDPEIFCCQATTGSKAEMPVWVITDARRQTDIKYFREHYEGKVQLVRIVCDDNVREERGFMFTQGVDDAESECGLDVGVNWDIVIHNNGNTTALKNKLDLIAEDLKDVHVLHKENPVKPCLNS